MKTQIILTSLSLALAYQALAQGPLTPPPGADPSIGPVNALTPGGLPQGTMKTLNQVEPRTAIPGGTSTVTLSQSGSYFLTGNIAVSTGNGVLISASNVTLDLNGFSITTSSITAAGNGIQLGQSLQNISIRNGNIGGDGAGGAFLGGVLYVVSGFPQPPRNLRVADLSISASEFGISTSSTVISHVERCLVFGGSVHGIQGMIVKDCVVEGGPILGRIVKDCSVTSPGVVGIVADVAENCAASSSGNAFTVKTLHNSYGTGGGASDVIAAGVAQNVWAEGGSGSGDGIEATVASNAYGKRQNDLGGTSTGDGLKAQVGSASSGSAAGGSGVSGSLMHLVQGQSTSSNGIQAEVVAFSRVASSGGIGIAGANVFGSFAKNNTGKGIYSALVGNSRADFNGQGGLVTDGGVVNNSVAFTNTGAGVEGGVVTGVWASSNTLAGIDSVGSVTNSYAQSNAGGGVKGRSVVGVVAHDNQTAGILIPTVGGAEYGAVALSVADSNNGVGISGGNSAILSCASGRNHTGFLHKSAAMVGNLAHSNSVYGIEGTSFSAHSLNYSGFNLPLLGNQGASLSNYFIMNGPYDVSRRLGNANASD